VDMTQVRDEPFAVNTAADSDQSKADGSFCIRYIRPAKYLLTAERLDVKDYIRWAGYYPGVAKRSQAKMIEVHGGDNLADLQFSVGKVRVHTVLFHIVSADGSLLPLKNLGVSVDAPERDALAYHLTQTRNINGEFPAGYVPPGNYLVQTYVPEDRKDPGGTVALAHGQARNVYRNGFGDRPYAESRELDFTRSSLSLSGKKFSPRRRASTAFSNTLASSDFVTNPCACANLEAWTTSGPSCIDNIRMGTSGRACLMRSAAEKPSPMANKRSRRPSN
jgi:hypothetical protein